MAKAHAQEPTPNPTTQQQLEDLAAATDVENEDDSYTQQLKHFSNQPLNLNEATVADLQAFVFLKPLQIQAFTAYRTLLGKFINIFELQAVPYWDLETIHRIRPFVYVGEALSLKENLTQLFSNGQHSFMARASQILEKSKGFTAPDSSSSKYLGSRQHLGFRYKYQYKNLLQYGLVADKDAGEQLFKGQQSQGFDFYSFHFFAKNLGIIKHLALGDFTVNLGQGLISWQTLAFRKSSDAMAIKRQAEILRPYNSPGEFNFHRGLGITLQKKNWQTTTFISYKKISANVVLDTVIYEDHISSILSSGYHRTLSELQDKNTISQFAFGGNISYNKQNVHFGFNAIHYQFSKALQKDYQPYNIFNFSGKSLTNVSIDYGFTHKNFHLFGEIATDQNKNFATVNGLIASLDSKIDASLLYRNISRSYASFNANAFTETTLPINENGLYMGISFRPNNAMRIDAYADVFSFPWLRYLVDKPSTGSEFLVQLNWQPNKQILLYTKYKNENKAINVSGTNLPTHITLNKPKQTWRTHLAYQINRDWTLNTRAEILWFDKKSEAAENGFLTFAEIGFNPKGRPYGGNVRLQYFETDSYNSRIYAFESDMLYSYSIPASFYKGYRYYFNFNYDIGKKATFWLRFSQTIQSGKTSFGSGYDEISGNLKSEIKLQGVFYF